jgi:hypothetical protein
MYHSNRGISAVRMVPIRGSEDGGEGSCGCLKLTRGKKEKKEKKEKKKGEIIFRHPCAQTHPEKN